MLKHVYIDNFRCLVNFELDLGPQQLLVGLNGTGKSTLLDALNGVKRLVTGEGHPNAVFPEGTHTRWRDASRQTFELQIELEGCYRLRIELEPWGSPPVVLIKRELVTCDGRPLFEFENGEVTLFNDNFERKVTYPFDRFRSPLATIDERPDNRRLMRLLGWVRKLHCLRLNPSAMSGQAESEDPAPKPDMSNFASWYRYRSQEERATDSRFQAHLGMVFPNLGWLNLRDAGAKTRILSGFFAQTLSPVTDGMEIAFDELSDGQRVLICLYAILEFLVRERACVFLDEPENFLALSEIQPWLMELRDRVDDDGGQVILISHHPELIDYLAPEIGLVFERSGSGAVRVKKYTTDEKRSLPPSEQIARGWSSNG